MNTEVRIGNIVGTYEPHMVNGIYLSHFTAVNKNGVEHNSVQYNLSPIPLTPEILEKAGFDEIEGNEYYRFFKHASFVVFLHRSQNSIFASWEGVSIESTINNLHVHQLQNLYFALTGEELKIEL